MTCKLSDMGSWIFWGKSEESHSKALQCRSELEKESGAVFVMGLSPAVTGANPVDAFYFVYGFPNCEDGAAFNLNHGPNQQNAETCAKELGRITGKHYEAVMTEQRSIFYSDVYSIFETK